MTAGHESRGPCCGLQPTRMRDAGLLLAWIAVLAVFFAQVEIQIEGAAGWAANLPTWRIDNHPLLNVFWGGKPLTGYHVWVFSFMALVFHLPLFFHGTFNWKLEARIIGSVMVFWILEDLLWFVMNPAFGLARLNPGSVPWHRHWIFGMPVDYPVFLVLGGALMWYSFAHRKTAGEKQESGT